MTDRELAEIAQGYLAEITRLRAENARLREERDQYAAEAAELEALIEAHMGGSCSVGF